VGRSLDVPHQLGADVAIYRIDLPADAVVPPDAVGQVELARAARLRDRAEALRFLASHALLRIVLASALGRSRNQLALTADALGKPRLAGDPIRFNMSRSGAALLIGLSETREIGVDVELGRDVSIPAELARTHLAGCEFAAWQAEDERSRDAMFLELWTRKEACTKAAGTGLSLPLACVEVGVDSRHSPTSVAFSSGSCEWHGKVESLALMPGAFAAAAVTA
jgi:4'-phosphopantetheinyl transferase